jgi:hypothetical protein
LKFLRASPPFGKREVSRARSAIRQISAADSNRVFAPIAVEACRSRGDVISQ